VSGGREFNPISSPSFVPAFAIQQLLHTCEQSYITIELLGVLGGVKAQKMIVVRGFLLLSFVACLAFAARLPEFRNMNSVLNLNVTDLAMSYYLSGIVKNRVKLGFEPLEGYFQINYYCANESPFKFSPVKQFFALNQCAEYWDHSMGTYFAKQYFGKDDSANYITKTVAYADEQCSNSLGNGPVVVLPHLDDVTFNHYDRALSKPNSANLFIGVYDKIESCQENDPSEGLLQADYFLKNVCYSPSGGNDIIFTACNEKTGLTYLTYSSSDNSCTGKVTNSILIKANSQSETCRSKESLGDYGFFGYFNFRCS
jgi:hypothetical protein